MMEHIMQPNASLYCSRISRSLCDSHNCQQTSIPPCAAVWCQQYQMHRSPTILQPWRGDIKQHSGCHIHPKKPRCQLKLTSLPPTFVSLPLSVPSACFTLFFSTSVATVRITSASRTVHAECCLDTSQCHTLTSAHVFLQVKGAIMCIMFFKHQKEKWSITFSTHEWKKGALGP